MDALNRCRFRARASRKTYAALGLQLGSFCGVQLIQGAQRAMIRGRWAGLTKASV